MARSVEEVLVQVDGENGALRNDWAAIKLVQRGDLLDRDVGEHAVACLEVGELSDGKATRCC